VLSRGVRCLPLQHEAQRVRQASFIGSWSTTRVSVTKAPRCSRGTCSQRRPDLVQRRFQAPPRSLHRRAMAPTPGAASLVPVLLTKRLSNGGRDGNHQPTRCRAQGGSTILRADRQSTCRHQPSPARPRRQTANRRSSRWSAERKDRARDDFERVAAHVPGTGPQPTGRPRGKGA